MNTQDFLTDILKYLREKFILNDFEILEIRNGELICGTTIIFQDDTGENLIYKIIIAPYLTKR